MALLSRAAELDRQQTIRFAPDIQAFRLKAGDLLYLALNWLCFFAAPDH